jgi:hypothetical protein
MLSKKNSNDDLLSKKYFLTFDVGTINLAFCIVEYDPITLKKNIIKSINIVDWGIIDVSYKPLYCKHIKNKRAICNCISKYYTLKENCLNELISDNLIGYCKTHAKPIIESNKINKKNKIKIKKISENPIYNNSFVIQMERLLNALNIFYNNNILNPYDIDSNGNPIYISNLRVYIENQPVLKNPVKKTISIGIFTYFTLKKISNPNIISNVNFINAIVKTKDDFIAKLFELIEIKSYITKFKEYDKRKQFTIDITNQIIDKLDYSINNIVSFSKYNLTKKKDDMADTLVYIIYIIIYML